MNALDKMVKMLDAAGEKYTKSTVGKDNVVLTVQVPEQEGCVRIIFVDNGDSFLTSSFYFNNLNAKQKLDNKMINLPTFLSSDKNNNYDYDDVLDIIKSAKQKLGDYYEAESEDGMYLGILYLDHKEEFGTAFVFYAHNRRLLRVVGIGH